MGSFFHLLILLKEFLLGQEKIVTAVGQERRLEKALKDLAMLKDGTIIRTGKHEKKFLVMCTTQLPGGSF